MENKTNVKYIEKIFLFLIAIIPLVYFKQVENVPVKAFILGSGSWGIGCIFKMLTHQIIVKPLQKNDKALWITSLTNGFISGFFELIAAYIIILVTKDKFVFNYDAIISFGLAIGSIEILAIIRLKGNEVFKGTALEKSSEKIVEFANNLHGFQYIFFNLFLSIAERIIAIFIHISTRGLVFITIITGNMIPILIALLVFIIADGPLGYYYNISGKLATSKGFIRIHLYLFILTAINTLLFFVLIHPYRNIAL